MEYILGEILVTVNKIHPDPANDEKLKWFLFTELYNNYQLFEKVLKGLYPDNWEVQLKMIRNLVC